MYKKNLLLVLLATALTCGQIAFGADEVVDKTDDAVKALRKTTVTATRTEESVDDVPATVSVITSEQIEDELATDIKDLMRFEPGVSVRNSPAVFTAAGSSIGRDGNSGFNIRGLEGNRVLMMVDGVRLPDAFSFGAQSVGRGDYVDLDLLKSVEILRGPASALYGSDGVTGAVSFTTKDPDDFLKSGASFGIRARAGYSSADDSSSEGFATAARGERWQALLAYTRRDASAQENQGVNNSANTTRTTPIPQDIVSNAVLGKLIFVPNDAHRLRLTLDHLDRRIDSTVLSAIAAPPPPALTSTSTLALLASDDIKRDRISLDHRYKGAGGFIDSAKTAIYYQTSRTREYSAEDRNTAADRIRDNVFDNEVIGVDSQLSSVLSAGRAAHRLTYGIDASQTRQEGLRDGTIPPGGESFPTRAFPITDYALAGAYMQDEIAILDDRLRLYPAVRYDYYSVEPQNDSLFAAVPGVAAPGSRNDTHLSPKVGAVWQITRIVGVFANYGEGFKAPAPSQVNNGFTNVVQNYRSISNPDLKPEISRTSEAGVRLKFARASVGVTGFNARYEGFIEQIQIAGNFSSVNPAIYQYINLSGAKIQGAELKAEAELGMGFTAQTAVSYARGDRTINGVDTPLNSVEPWKLVAGVSWRNAARRYGGQLIATHSARKESDRIEQTCTPSCFTPPAFTILDSTAWFNFTDTLTLRAAIFNLTDKKYWWWSDVRGQSSTSTRLDAFTQPGRNASASLTWRM